MILLRGVGRVENQFIDKNMIEVFIYETSQILENLEQVIISSEKNNDFSKESINQIFRFMHTIKGSSAMMECNNMSKLAHKIEDIFYVIREKKDIEYDYCVLTDLILESIDYFKIELLKIENSETSDGEVDELTGKFSEYLNKIKLNKSEEVFIYKAKVHFEKNCQMENIRAYTMVFNLDKHVVEIYYTPINITDNAETAEIIRQNGFEMIFKSKKDEKTLKGIINESIFLQKIKLEKIAINEFNCLVLQYSELKIKEEKKEEIKTVEIIKKDEHKEKHKEKHKDISISTNQNIISVHVDKLDKLMDMVGELVIAEAMVTQNPEVTRLEIESFEKSSRQLHKITGELQDLVMDVRMVPLSTTFMKMHRILRDMTKKLNKKVGLNVIGEETEVDKNIIEKISDPLMHIIRNGIDHGIEDEETRVEKGKNIEGTITLEAKNSGSDVLVIIKDDGKGLNKKEIYNKANKQGLVQRDFEDMSDKEIFNLILTPGFSTNAEVTEFSGRGVGMDVVCKNISSIGGTVVICSKEGEGTTITLKIPLTLAIIEGMNIKVGQSRFTIPIIAIKESFRPNSNKIIKDLEGHEMIMVRGECYPVLRLHDLYAIKTDITLFEEGILIMIEAGERNLCVFADELLGQQQVVVKSFPEYIKKHKKIKGLGGCTLLGDGSISLIIDVSDLKFLNGVGCTISDIVRR